MKCPTMLQQVNEYLWLRRSLGFQMQSQGEMLLQFAGHLDGTGHRGPLTTETALRWANLPHLSRSTREEAFSGALFRPVSNGARRPDGGPESTSGTEGLLSPTTASLQFM